MGKKIMTGLIALAFVCSSLFVFSACAKKYIDRFEKHTGQVSKGMAPAPTPEKAPEKPKVAVEDLDKARREAYIKGFQLFQQEKIYFEFDKSDLTPSAKAVLKTKADWVAQNTVKFKIEGHCDERGSNAYNLALGQRRADSAMKFLNALGISANRMTTISYGEEKPADPAHNETAWAKNRRCEFTLGD